MKNTILKPLREKRGLPIGLIFSFCTLFQLLLIVFPLCCVADSPDQQLQEKYHDSKDQLENNSFNLPLLITSSCEATNISCDIFGKFDCSFKQVSDVLSDIYCWPEIMLLHENIKTCIVQNQNGVFSLTFYFGRKKYQPPEKAYKITMAYNISQKSDDFLDIDFTAEEGPLLTRNYKLQIQAVPIEKGTFIRFYCTYDYGYTLKTALNLYYKTLARNKVGFTITSYDKNNDPVYVRGTQGVIERNAVRYYFAILSFLNSMELAKTEHFDRSMIIWYTLISKFPKQLVELKKEVYIENKTKERKNQIQYQTKALRLNNN